MHLDSKKQLNMHEKFEKYTLKNTEMRQKKNAINVSN